MVRRLLSQFKNIIRFDCISGKVLWRIPLINICTSLHDSYKMQIVLLKQNDISFIRDGFRRPFFEKSLNISFESVFFLFISWTFHWNFNFSLTVGNLLKPTFISRRNLSRLSHKNIVEIQKKKMIEKLS